MVGQGTHAIFRSCFNVIQIGKKHPWTIAAHIRSLVIGARSGFFGKFRHPFYHHIRFGANVEGFIQTSLDLFNNGSVIFQNLLAAFIGIRIIETLFFSQCVNQSGKAQGGIVAL